MDYNNFNNYELTHKDKLRIYYLVSQYYMCLGLQIENYKGILNRNNFIQEPIILYVSTPKNTICKSAMRKNNEDLCGIELAKKFKLFRNYLRIRYATQQLFLSAAGAFTPLFGFCAATAAAEKSPTRPPRLSAKSPEPAKTVKRQKNLLDELN